MRAARLAGAALELRAAAGHPPSAGAGARLEDLLGPARRSLGELRAATLLEEGRAMGADEAVRYAMGTRPAGSPRLRRRARGLAGPGPAGTASPAAAAAPGPAAGPPAGGATVPSTLTPREREIAALIARGLSNRAIADELVISQATVARHVANMLTKLGFSSRAQIAAWVARPAPARPARTPEKAGLHTNPPAPPAPKYTRHCIVRRMWTRTRTYVRSSAEFR